MKDAVKFGYILFRNLNLRLSENKSSVPFNDGEKVIFSTVLPKMNDSTWEKWLGLEWKNIVDSNAMLSIEMPTESPGVVNGESNILRLMKK